MNAVRCSVLVGAAFCLATSVAAQTTAKDFPDRPHVSVSVPAFTDRDISSLTATLDARLASPGEPGKWRRDADVTLWNFARQLQAGRLTATQEQRVLAHLEALGVGHRERARLLGDTSAMIRQLTVGKTAPDIVGRDLEGHPLRLASFRGRVVVVSFSAEWCAICKTQFPYERLLAELYGNWPFTMLGVETGSSVEAARQMKQQQRLTYKSWWDGPSDDRESGAIADAWHVLGFPMTYLIDGRGTIRYVGLRDEELLLAVRAVLDEEITRTAQK